MLICVDMFVYSNGLLEIWGKSTNGFQLWLLMSIILLVHFWGENVMSDFG